MRKGQETSLLRELFTCGHCGTHGEGVLAGSFENYLGDPWDRSDDWLVYKLLKCEYCRRPTVTSAVERREEDFTWIENKTQVFPGTGREQSSAVPESIRSSIEEAKRCLQADAPVAAAIMVRRTIEALAQDKKAVGKNLAQLIEGLRSSGHIDARLFAWADALRLAGNSAAHDVERRTDPDDVRDMIHLAEAILDYVYVIQDRYERFQQRRQNPAEAEQQPS